MQGKKRNSWINARATEESWRSTTSKTYANGNNHILSGNYDRRRIMARPWTLRRLRTPLIVLVIILVFGRLTGILSRHVILGLLNRQNTAYLPRLEYAKRTEAQIILDDLAGNSTLGVRIYVD